MRQSKPYVDYPLSAVQSQQMRLKDQEADETQKGKTDRPVRARLPEQREDGWGLEVKVGPDS